MSLRSLGRTHIEVPAERAIRPQDSCVVTTTSYLKTCAPNNKKIRDPIIQNMWKPSSPDTIETVSQSV